jgi:putative endonuclease
MTNCYTYILRCADGSLYTGWTNDLEQRLKVHNEGTGAKYTKRRRPVTLIRYWTFETRSEAMKFECKVKALSRPKKLALIEEASPQSALADTQP